MQPDDDRRRTSGQAAPDAAPWQSAPDGRQPAAAPQPWSPQPWTAQRSTAPGVASAPGWQPSASSPHPVAWPSWDPLSGHDAPLIHPAAAQASNATPYGVPVYRAPTVAYAPVPQRHLSITALVLGLCSATFGWLFVVVPLIGVVFGVLALRREPAGRTFAIIGLVTSVLGILWVLVLYLLPLLAFLTAITMSMGP